MSEIHGGHHHSVAGDRFGTIISVVVAVIGILLAVVTIESHRAHTAAIVHKTEANDKWNFYQAKRIRGHVSDVGATLLTTLSNDANRNASAIEKLQADIKRYSDEADKLKHEADEKDAEVTLVEQQATCFDLGEGLVELGLVLSSLYFLSHRKLFPHVGMTCAAIGLVIGVGGATQWQWLMQLFAH